MPWCASTWQPVTLIATAVLHQTTCSHTVDVSRIRSVRDVYVPCPSAVLTLLAVVYVCGCDCVHMYGGVVIPCTIVVGSLHAGSEFTGCIRAWTQNQSITCTRRSKHTHRRDNLVEGNVASDAFNGTQ